MTPPTPDPTTTTTHATDGPGGLKACPFCGKPAGDIAMDIGRKHGLPHSWFCPWCPECGLHGPTFDTEAEAIAWWNTRPGEDALRSELEDCSHNRGNIEGALRGMLADALTREYAAKADRDRLAARVAELESQIEDARQEAHFNDRD